MVRRPGVSARYIVSGGASLMGNSVAGVVMPLVLLSRTGDVLAAGCLALICAVPQVLAGIVGGALLDRLNRRDVAVASDLVSAACVAALPVVDAVAGLSFGWFVLFGVLGAVGDVPGMTARDTLLPAVAERDRRDLQSFVGVQQTVESVVTVVGPAFAAIAMGAFGPINALWITSGLSVLAVLAMLTVPRGVGGAHLPSRGKKRAPRPLLREALRDAGRGFSLLVRGDRLLLSSVALALLLVMAVGGFQGLVLPAYYSSMGTPELVGFVTSACSLGTLVGSLVYTRFALDLSRRLWYVLSFLGMSCGIAVIGLLPDLPLMIAGAAVLGFSAGPLAALLNFFVFDSVPEADRGSVLGTQNALYLAASPASMFLCSAMVTAFGLRAASLLLIASWTALAVFALSMKTMRRI
ncbi:MFS transporter [Gordonibacter urolithinfaciens]|uniref:MFS transporter n=1 Tax=Gordonibacter urolithinfaciens TaxID=1335613 RepID=UPI003A8DA707